MPSASHVVEPDVVRAAGVGLGEEQDGGGDAGVGLEHAAGQRDDGVELLFLDEHLAQRLVRVGRAEEHAVGHDDGGASAGLAAGAGRARGRAVRSSSS